MAEHTIMKSASSREPPARYPCFHCVGALNGDYAGRISPFEHRLSLFVVGYWNRETSIRPSFLEGSLKCASSSPCRNIVSTAHLILGFRPPPDLEDPPAIVAGPDAQNVLSISDTEHSPTNLLTSLCELVADYSNEKVLPVSICDSFLQSHDPFATPLIFVILPDWSNAFLEYVVVRNEG